MLLADKIIELRKKKGMSQEELANMLNVSRQAVSKWESNQSMPDIDKIIKMADLFMVSTDYLLKENVFIDENIINAETNNDKKLLSLEEANSFITLRRKNAKLVSLATALCIISPTVLIYLAAYSERSNNISESLAAILGLVFLFVLIAIAVAIFMWVSFLEKDYDYLNKNEFETAYGVSSYIKEKKKEYRINYIRNNIIGVIVCILAVIPLLIAAFTEDEMLIISTVVLLLVLISLGTTLFVNSNIIMSSYSKILEEDDYSRKNKRNNSIQEKISGIYWILALIVYFIWSFSCNSWKESWIVWPIAALLYVLVYNIVKIVVDKKH